LQEVIELGNHTVLAQHKKIVDIRTIDSRLMDIFHSKKDSISFSTSSDFYCGSDLHAFSLLWSSRLTSSGLESVVIDEHHREVCVAVAERLILHKLIHPHLAWSEMLDTITDAAAHHHHHHNNGAVFVGANISPDAALTVAAMSTVVDADGHAHAHAHGSNNGSTSNPAVDGVLAFTEKREPVPFNPDDGIRKVRDCPVLCVVVCVLHFVNVCMFTDYLVSFR
jgi:hypothetical protein